MRNFGIRRRLASRSEPEKSAERKKKADDSAEDDDDALPNRGKLYVEKNEEDNPKLITDQSLFKILFSMRIAAVFYATITDCDETYNYWEPLHFFLYGRGLQTWEYSPEYAIRSYFYIQLHYVPTFVIQFLCSSKLLVFTVLRALFAWVSSSAEFALFTGVCYRFGNRTGTLFLLAMAFSAGMYNASVAFLPSSFSMIVNMVAMAAYLQEAWKMAITCTAISALVGWPFCAVLALPVVVDMLFLRKFTLKLVFFRDAILAGVSTIAFMYMFDSQYYGKGVLAPLNIVLYNVISGHGPELYGTEPVSFYFKNLFLNWNIAVPFAFISLPLAAILYSRTFPAKELYHGIPRTLKYWRRLVPLILLYSTMMLWVLIFFRQPHKEERFLFPIYPHICLFFAISLDTISRMLQRADFSSRIFNLPFSLVGISSLIALSRIIAMFNHYSGAVTVYSVFNEQALLKPQLFDFSGAANRSHDAPLVLCVGKEWYRFPSHFFLPESVSDYNGNKRKVELGFLRSEFRGILPKQYPRGDFFSATKTIPEGMNDENKEEMDRYTTVEWCDFIVDNEPEGEGTFFEPNFSRNPDFKPVTITQFLRPHKTHPVLRSFYVPGLMHTKGLIDYSAYTLYGRRTLYRRV